MKQKFLKLTRWVTLLCLAMLAVTAVLLAVLVPAEGELPNWLGIPFLGILYLTIVLLLIVFCLSLAQAIRARDRRYFVHLGTTAVLLAVLQLVLNARSDDPQSVPVVLLTSVALAAAAKAGESIFAKK